jgi:NAD+ kinase
MRFNIVERGDDNSKAVAADLKKRLEEIGWIYDDDNFLMLFSIGGDGTLLRSIHMYIDKLDKIQFLAIHTGTLGFFTDYTQNELDQLVKDLQINPYKIDTYPLLEMQLPQVNEKLYALNEVRIESLSKTLVLDIYIDNEFFESTRGSGICVSTQMGSTGVNRALKGAVIDPGLHVLELCEIMPISHKGHHSLKNPYIMQESRKVIVKGDTLSYGHVCYDHLERNLDSISEIHISTSNKKVRFARYRTYSYLKRLKNLY